MPHAPAGAFGNPERQAAHPQVLSRGNHVVRAWQEYDGEYTDALVQHSTNRGVDWSTTEVAMRTAGAADYPFLIANDQAVFLAWLTAAEGYRLTQPLPPQQHARVTTGAGIP